MQPVVRDLDLLRRLRKYELNVIEVADWQTRGKPGLVNAGHLTHHTAGSRNGNTPSLNAVINGLDRPDLGYHLDGPLAQTYTPREPDFTVYLVASGIANHAGKGGFDGYSGNGAFSGTEHEHTGYASEPVSADKWETLARVAAAHADGHFGADRCINHFEWTDRKIDFVESINNPSAFRRRVDELLRAGGAPNPNPSEDDMTPEQEAKLDRLLASNTRIEAELRAIKALAGKGLAFVLRDPRDNKAWIFTDDGRWHVPNRKVLNTLVWTGVVGAYGDKIPVGDPEFIDGVPEIARPVEIEDLAAAIAAEG